MKCNILPSNKFHKPKASVQEKNEETKKTTTMAMPESRAVWIFTAFAVLTFTVVSSVDDKCSACYAVADELERGLSNEKPRNHLDMRNRLNSKGQREGKVIDYRVSDLRVVELLDGLCDKMQDYTLQKVDSSRSAWVKVDSWDKLTSNKQEARAHSKAMSSYCGRLLEETEDELADLIKKGSVKVGGVSKVLCQDLSKHCKSSDIHQETHSNDEDSDADSDSDSDSDDESHGEL